MFKRYGIEDLTDSLHNVAINCRYAMDRECVMVIAAITKTHGEALVTAAIKTVTEAHAHA